MSTPLLVKSEGFLRWLLGATARWPKSHRHGLTTRVEGAAVDFVGAVVYANRARGRERASALAAADGHLDIVRILLRVASDLKYLSGRQFEFVARSLEEIGRLLGGWLRADGEGSSR